ncbi:hypothetical protein JCGZ_10886 [Jatropha curcas]|uniref:rRNA N-glycosylase n=1 Tax=Jatropha curcas TaxID=180498 RepID=I3V675_JATCU|nr:ribosome-inactivating protein cucurmosin-like [Jatropha curcas]XP_020536136.1 ribosome-inactivating protein cucurmosin-like isoform X1 [Jatropha curcas]AFK73428.1 type 1 ribosomal inactivating protein [Jatropha curcas]KDP34681.1 hypothetical protein JCGZ_10886 [Jatropha curcas]
MEGKMKVWVVVATWLSWTVIFGLARFICPLAIHNHTVDAIPSVSFTISRIPDDDKTGYKQLMVDLRNKLASGTTSNGVPVLRTTASKEAKYLLVNIINTGNKEITLGLNVINAYVLAYKVGDNSYFFNDPTELKDAQTYLFKDTKQNTIKMTGSYDSLKAQGGDRETMDIGIGQLDSHIYTLHKSTALKDIAKPLVCIIQMVSEAARFKYIEKKIIDEVEGGFTPKLDVISRENNWGGLSEGIENADKNGKFKTTVRLQNEDSSAKVISKVDEIIVEMGVLLYVKKKSYIPSFEQTIFGIGNLILNQINLLPRL